AGTCGFRDWWRWRRPPARPTLHILSALAARDERRVHEGDSGDRHGFWFVVPGKPSTRLSIISPFGPHGSTVSDRQRLVLTIPRGLAKTLRVRTTQPFRPRAAPRGGPSPSGEDQALPVVSPSGRAR